MSRNKLSALDLFNFVLADQNYDNKSGSQYNLRWYEVADQLENNENYKKLTDSQQDKFDKDLLKIVQDKEVKEAVSSYISMDRTVYDSEEELNEAEEDSLSQSITAILNTKEAQKYYNGEYSN